MFVIGGDNSISFPNSRMSVSNLLTLMILQPGDVLDLNNSDLLAVTVVLKDGARQRRFLVVDLMQIILIEPDSHRLGWGVARFSGFLQDLEVGV